MANSITLLTCDLEGTLLRHEVPLTEVIPRALDFNAEIELAPEIIHEWSEAYLASRQRNLANLKESTFLDALMEVNQNRDLRLASWEMMKILGVMYRRINYPTVSLIKGAEEALSYVRSRGVKIGIISNTAWPGKLHEEDLYRFGLRGYIDFCVWSSDLGIKKPNPQIFSETLAIVGVSPEQAIHMGNSLAADAEGASAAGISPLLISEEVLRQNFSRGWQVKDLFGAAELLSEIL